MVEWNTFIGKVKEKGLTTCVPLILVEQLGQRFSDSHKLENLLKRHEKALCKELQDKIYGFTRLAIDCYGRLLVDYGKTLFEVWKDVVMFQYNSPEPHTDTVDFARFLLHLLGGPERVGPKEPNYSSRAETGSGELVLDT